MDELFVVGGQHATQTSQTFATDRRSGSRSPPRTITNDAHLLFSGRRCQKAAKCFDNQKENMAYTGTKESKDVSKNK
ncbi:hypothetical protein Y032_0603g523 [Ancylostoma ceylanicum]|uniref:Uncharacterized protein n=1 Tax=Ancylostoma ceylanicum TaxID=53326 RepID=A0A016WNQ4_9BILA|nr:hypothetical protein Y032_0603g523 [Ancylostoma ceylanicum]